jgi:alkylhydroperoxidase family enzyme
VRLCLAVRAESAAPDSFEFRSAAAVPSGTSVSATDADGLRRHGWSDAGIHDAIQVIAFFNYINRVADGVGIELEPEWADSPTI